MSHKQLQFHRLNQIRGLTYFKAASRKYNPIDKLQFNPINRLRSSTFKVIQRTPLQYRMTAWVHRARKNMSNSSCAAGITTCSTLGFVKDIFKSHTFVMKRYSNGPVQQLLQTKNFFLKILHWIFPTSLVNPYL